MPPAKRAIGYMQAMPGTTFATLRQFEKSLRVWARVHGFDLDKKIFVDTSFASSEQFDAMILAIEGRADERPEVVILPHSYALAPTNHERVRKETILDGYGITTTIML